uniref:Uncharacterized protein n=1 Tax=Manihot esculenta TaxID=3983 RepID=A0A2C9W4F7_MANES
MQRDKSIDKVLKPQRRRPRKQLDYGEAVTAAITCSFDFFTSSLLSLFSSYFCFVFCIMWWVYFSESFRIRCKRQNGSISIHHDYYDFVNLYAGGMMVDGHRSTSNLFGTLTILIK